MSVLEDALEKARELCDAIVEPGPDRRPIAKIALELSDYLVAAEVETEEVYNLNRRQGIRLTASESTLRCVKALLDSKKLSDDATRLKMIREFIEGNEPESV